MKNIAVINLGYIGDVVNASSVCVALKRAYPDSNLIFVTVPTSVETAKCLPGVDDVIAFDRYNGHKGLKMFNLAFKIRQKYKLDAAFLLTDNFRCALFSFLIGAKRRIGRSNEGRDFLLTHKIPFLPEEKSENVHISDFYLRVLKPILKTVPDTPSEFIFSEEDKQYAVNLLAKNGYSGEDLIGLCPCSAREFKDWGFDEAAKFVKYVIQNTDKKVVIVGTKKGQLFSKKLSDQGTTEFIDLTCQTSLSQLAALVSMFKAFVSVDSAPMHIGIAVKTPTVALFFQNNYKKWGPKDLEKHRLIFASEIKAENVIKQLGL